MNTKEQKQEEWKPEPAKHAKDWVRIYYDLIDTRRFQIRQTHGPEAAERYRYHSAERDYFYMWGKLPHHVIEDKCEVCDQEQARRVASWVDAHHRAFFEQMHGEFMKYVKAYQERMEKNFKRAANMPAYKGDLEERERLIQYAAKWIAQIRADMKPSANLGGDATTKGQQGDAPAQQGAKEADSTQADTHTAEE